VRHIEQNPAAGHRSPRTTVLIGQFDGPTSSAAVAVTLRIAISALEQALAGKSSRGRRRPGRMLLARLAVRKVMHTTFDRV